MRKCVNPACLADFAFDDSMTNCPFCHSRLESCGGTDAPPLVPPFGPSDGGDPYDVEDYSNAEDFYAAHRADFGSLDEAEMYFDDHRR